MSSVDPPELPKLPPIRESAEQVLPPATGEPPPETAAPGGETPGGGSRRTGRELERERRRQGQRSASGSRAGSPSPPGPPTAAGRRRGGRIPRSEDGRRLSTAGHALIVAVLALTFGALLLAPGMHKAAYNGQPGTKRDVSLALTAALADVSHALLLDRPRLLVQDAIGRRGADEINVAIVAPPPTTTAARATPATKPAVKHVVPGPPTKQAFTPQKKLRVWIAGDSLVITPGYAIVRAAGPSPALETVGSVDGRVATGLTRPDVFNWFDEIRRQAKELRPKAVVLAFGGNDDKAYMTGLPDGASIGDFGSWAWRKEYGRRVGGVMDALNRAGAFVIWIGLPQTRDADQTRRFDVVNSVVVKQARKRPGRAAYIDTYTAFAGDDGGYAEYLATGSGQLEKVRAGDGVHFERAGGDIIARLVLRELNKEFDLTSWRKKPNA
jgi:hypothetical protein